MSHPNPQPLSFLFKYNLKVNSERLYTKTTRTQKATINACELMKRYPNQSYIRGKLNDREHNLAEIKTEP